MSGIPEPASNDSASLPANVKKKRSGGSGGSGEDWRKILSVIARSKYAKRVGVKIALSKYLEARSSDEINAAFCQIVTPAFWGRILYPTRQRRITAIINEFV